MATSQTTPLTWLEFKQAIREIVWPTGEAPNLVVPHDKFFVDALMDLQAAVPCLQQDNTDLINQCATLFKCGLTVIDAPRGNVMRVSVVDRLDDDGVEDVESPIDWCSEIFYYQIDPCHGRQYLSSAARQNNGWLWFGLEPGACGYLPGEPTDEGVDPALAPLPMGHHYAQVSTDKACRASAGRWWLERGRIYLFPAIQSTESVNIYWDGLKRQWNDSDQVDGDPLLASAVEAFVRWKGAEKYDRDEFVMASSQADFIRLRMDLVHQCREETRVRRCEPSQARSATLTQLYLNDAAQSATANCPSGQTGNSISITIAVGQISSEVSVSDANQKAKQEAQRQADDQLECTPIVASVGNDAQPWTAHCEAEPGAPIPEGDPVSVVIPANTYFAATKAEANNLALAAAQAQAEAGLSCVYKSRAVTRTAHCAANESVDDIEVTLPAGQFTADSQTEADILAATEAQAQADAQMAPLCEGSVIFNTVLTITDTWNCSAANCVIYVRVNLAAGHWTGQTQEEANEHAREAGHAFAFSKAQLLCHQHECGLHVYDFP